jgi:spore coat protein U-like protein
MRKMTVIAGMLMALLATRPALAASDSAQIQVSVQVVPNCRILVTELAFGSYDPLLQHATQPLDGTADLTVLCTKQLRASVLFNNTGTNARTMRSVDGTLTYSLFSDASRTKNWGTGSDAVQVIGTGSTPNRLTVYGRVPGSQIVAAGWYTDAVTATVDF